MRATLFLLPFLLLVACKDETADLILPEAVELTEDAAGYYCQMFILEHEGPKAQVFLAGMENPLWFSQVRDGLAYLLSPEQDAEVRVLYVNDMALAKSWSEPGINNWIKARSAYFVVGSDAIGGMGAPETVPFAREADAAAFAQIHGGQVAQFDEISVSDVLAPVEFDSADQETDT